MTHSSAQKSDEAVAPLTPAPRDGQRALIEHLAQAYVGSPQSPRRTASDTTRGLSVPLLYTELYPGVGFSEDMSQASVAPGSETHTNGSPYKHRAASSPDLEPLPEIECSLSLSSDASTHELPFNTDPPETPSHGVVSRKERNEFQLPPPAMVVENDAEQVNGNGIAGKYDGHSGVSGRSSDGRDDPFDPQHSYPSDACIFVANLLESAPDEKLSEALTVVFGRYGTVFIKIKRKATNMPYAFIQYTNASHAREAMQGARGARVLDRVCRMEPANSKRFWLVRRADGNPATVAEVQRALVSQGTARVQLVQDKILEALGIDHGIRVEFPQWDQSRDLRRTMSAQYVAEPLDEWALLQRGRNATAHARLGRKLNGEGGDQNGTGEKNSTEAPSRWGSFMERYDRDRRSVFCGNLPSNTTEPELRQVFGRVGDPIKSIEIMRCAYSAYAFVEFSRADACEMAVGLLDGTDLRGMSMKIERKRARVPNSVPNHPAHQQRFASMPHRGGSTLQREGRNFTRLPPPRQPHNGGFGAILEQNRNGGDRAAPYVAANGHAAPPLNEAVAQGQNGGGFPREHAQMVNYMNWLQAAQQQVQALQAAQALQAVHLSNGQQAQGSIRGHQDPRAQGGSRSPEHTMSAHHENGLGIGTGMPPVASVFNQFAVPYPCLPQNGAMLPGSGVPFGGLPFASPQLGPSYPMVPGHLVGVNSQHGPGINATGSPVNTNDLFVGPPPNAGNPVNGVDYPFGGPQTTGPGQVNGMAPYLLMQGGGIRGQNGNGTQRRVNGHHMPTPPGLNGGRDYNLF